MQFNKMLNDLKYSLTVLERVIYISQICFILEETSTLGARSIKKPMGQKLSPRQGELLSDPRKYKKLLVDLIILY